MCCLLIKSSTHLFSERLPLSYLFIQTVLTKRRSWLSSGMMPEKVTWVRLSARISAAYDKLLQLMI